MAKTKSTDFLVSTADIAFYVNDKLAFTGTTSLNTSISVSMEDQEITGGKGNKTLYKFKYGRKLAPTIEEAEWNLAYIAANLGSNIFTGLRDVFKVGECVTLVNGVGTLEAKPVGNVSVERVDGSIVEVTPVESTITVGNVNETVRCTYQYNTTVRRVTIDADSTPFVGRLIMTADKHNNQKGKVAEIQIEIPSFQLSGSFDISLEASGNTTTTLSGDALAVEGATCTDGSVYGYITEIPLATEVLTVSDIAVTPSKVAIAIDGTKQLSVIGIKGGLYSNVEIDTKDVTFDVENGTIAEVVDGAVKGKKAGTTTITAKYDTAEDVIVVTVG